MTKQKVEAVAGRVETISVLLYENILSLCECSGHVGAIIPVLLVDRGQGGSCQRRTNVCKPHQAWP